MTTTARCMSCPAAAAVRVTAPDAFTAPEPACLEHFLGMRDHIGQFTAVDLLTGEAVTRSDTHGGPFPQPVDGWSAPAAPAAPAKLVFETTECGRCGGTGSHSYNQITGSTCFGCRGGKRVLSAKGRRARQAYDAAIAERCTVPLAELEPGDRIYEHNSAQFMSSRKGWVTVQSVEPSRSNPGLLTLRVQGPGPGLTAPADYRIRISRPQATAEIMAEIARRFGGATLA